MVTHLCNALFKIPRRGFDMNKSFDLAQTRDREVVIQGRVSSSAPGGSVVRTVIDSSNSTQRQITLSVLTPVPTTGGRARNLFYSINRPLDAATAGFLHEPVQLN